MMTFLKTVTLVATLLTVVSCDGATDKPQYYRCHFDWCSPPWQYCSEDEERCAPCSIDLCRRSFEIPKNCTQACKELLSPKTTTQTPGLLVNSSVDDRLEAISQRLHTLQILVIAILIFLVVLVVLAVIALVVYYIVKTRCKGGDDDIEQAEEKKPLQASESYDSSESRASQTLERSPFANAFPGETALDRGEPPIPRTIAVGPDRPAAPGQSGLYSSPNKQPHTFLTSASQFFSPSQVPPRGTGAVSMPGGPVRHNMTGSALPLSMPMKQLEANRFQDHKGFEADLDVAGNCTLHHTGSDVSYDTDSTAPKSNNFGTRPLNM